MSRNFFCLAPLPLLESSHRHDVLAASLVDRDVADRHRGMLQPFVLDQSARLTVGRSNFGLHLAPDALERSELMVAVLHLDVFQVQLGRPQSSCQRRCALFIQPGLWSVGIL
jgi:hypothetical protein